MFIEDSECEEVMYINRRNVEYFLKILCQYLKNIKTVAGVGHILKSYIDESADFVSAEAPLLICKLFIIASSYQLRPRYLNFRLPIDTLPS